MLKGDSCGNVSDHAIGTSDDVGRLNWASHFDVEPDTREWLAGQRNERRRTDADALDFRQHVIAAWQFSSAAS